MRLKSLERLIGRLPRRRLAEQNLDVIRGRWDASAAVGRGLRCRLFIGPASAFEAQARDTGEVPQLRHIPSFGFGRQAV